MPHGDDWDLLLAGYVDGSLSPSARRRVDEHLAGCPECLEDVAAALEGREALLKAAGMPAARGDFDSFLAGVERRAARGGAEETVIRPQPAGPFARLLTALGGADQVRPAAWFLLSLPVLGALLNPRGALVITAAIGLLLGALLEYALTWEVTSHD
jgi:anti-sigma factor RsiW